MRLRPILVALLALSAPHALAQSDLVSVPGFPTGGIPGQAGFDDFGESVSDAGDVNGDGYADLVVGAAFNDGGGTSAGRAYVFFGGPGADVVPDLTFTGEAPGDLFGASVSGAGDVNGDGYADLIVGAPAHDTGGTDAGRAYIYFGGPAADAVADLTLTGDTPGERLGESVSDAGDMNGDGFADLIVGAVGNDDAGAFTGRAYAYFGGPGADGVADVVMTGQAANDFFGVSVSGAGDINGDGFADVVVGADNAGSGGRATVYFGGPGADGVADLTLSGEASGDFFGASVSDAGDVDGDGFADVVVGAPRNDAGGSNAGRAYVYFGGPSADAVADLTLTGDAPNDRFGASVSDAGDANGDGYTDVIVGAALNDAGASNAGRAYVFFGGPGADTAADLVMTGDDASGDFGVSVSGAGDLDGDGLADVLVGANDVSTLNGSQTGAVYAFSNANTGAGIAEWRALGEASFDLFGDSVSDAGDVNGDGYADVIVGAPGNDAGGLNAGSAYIFFGGPSADAVADLTFTGEAESDNFGTSVSGAGDVNGDGYADVIVGANGFDNAGATNAGRAYVFFGGPSADAVADLTFTGETVIDEFGKSVSGARDVNGDGYADVIVGAPGYDDAGASNVGRAYVFFGGPSADAIADLTLTGEAVVNQFGTSVSDARDVNGDGYADVIVGAPGYNAGGSSAGRAYVFFGGPSADAVADLTLDSEAVDDRFGFSATGVGDVNSDGYPDLLVGALGNDAGGTNAGRAYVFFGGPSADAVADLTFTGEAAGDRLGLSVSEAGDVNGDGKHDIVLGTFITIPNATRKAYVHYGGVAVDTVADLDLFITNEIDNSRFGRSVSSAGDTDGDGRSEVLVGASSDTGLPGSTFRYSATGPAAAPGFYRLADIPGDQGGHVEIKWTRSDQETQGNASAYLVERSPPPGAVGFAWEPVATIPGTMRERYSLAGKTYSDQTGTNSGVTCFQITALGDAGDTWRSVVKCGASIDNLAPAAPASLLADASADGDVLVSVETLTAPPDDLAGYTVFRSADNVCDAGDTALGTVADDGSATVLFEDDATPFGTDVFYCATATDVHGNRSAFVGAASANPAVLAAIKVVLQGAYDASLSGGALMRTDLEDVLPLTQPYGPLGYTGTEAIDPTDESPANGRPDVLDAFAVVDWVLVELRTDPTVTSDKRAAALLLADGTLLDPATSAPFASVRPATPGSYHVAVTHRNHLAAMTAFAIGLDGAAPGTAYDLSASPAFVFGTNAVVDLGGRYGLAAGDADGDGSVLAGDRQSIWLPAVGQAGYLPADLNLDGSVLADDRQSFWTPNVGRASQVPGAASLTVGDDDESARRPAERARAGRR